MIDHTPPPERDPESSAVLSAVNYFAAALLAVLSVLVITGVL